MTVRWRGTIVYAGSLAVIGAATFARYGDVAVLGVPTAEGAQTQVSASPSSSPSVPGKKSGGPATAKPDDGDGSARSGDGAGGSGTQDAEGTQDTGTGGAAEQGGGSTTTGAGSDPEPAEPQDVTVTGAVATNKEGTFQVAVTFSGDTIVDVITVQAGHDSARSQQINEDAVPILRSEALQAQSANIDTVSGATYTSEGYRESLQSAIDQHG
ncbi:FMN-binding protein [Myceligenerans indicum]|uniref:FMN-binding protein n=1 Tax=Myceligenerans indicum TaxID=2593663 RepID=A0ABS1LFP3_9MICO|nr:FMN-binding protein [Myceligenerans indicum]MBL0885057.1 FMN-binding protein [Myceligenerans indicum]